MNEYVAAALEEFRLGRALPFTIRDARTQEIIGSTRIKEIDVKNRSCEIGNTWLARSHWRTGANRESKLMLLGHAFEEMSMHRVAFHVGAQNVRSRTAMLRLGAKQEGILRSRQVLPSGERRDWILYSILDYEWPPIKKRLQASLGASSSDQ